jgi:hypothetical protein
MHTSLVAPQLNVTENRTNRMISASQIPNLADISAVSRRGTWSYAMESTEQSYWFSLYCVRCIHTNSMQIVTCFMYDVES